MIIKISKSPNISLKKKNGRAKKIREKNLFYINSGWVEQHNMNTFSEYNSKPETNSLYPSSDTDFIKKKWTEITKIPITPLEFTHTISVFLSVVYVLFTENSERKKYPHKN